MNTEPRADIDGRFGEDGVAPTPWAQARAALATAELYWLSTVRRDGRPHVTPLIGVFHDDAVYFCTGLGGQKARNLEHRKQVALTTGSNLWAEGLDVVVEGTAVRVTDRSTLRRLAAAYLEKYGERWRFEVGDGVFGSGEHASAVFGVQPAKVLAFAKAPHAQTRYLFTERPAAG